MKSLPSTTTAKVLPRTPAQETAVRYLEARGWIVVTEPEDTFGGAMLLEGPPDGASVYLHPDGRLEG